MSGAVRRGHSRGCAQATRCGTVRPARFRRPWRGAFVKLQNRLHMAEAGVLSRPFVARVAPCRAGWAGGSSGLRRSLNREKLRYSGHFPTGGRIGRIALTCILTRQRGCAALPGKPARKGASRTGTSGDAACRPTPTWRSSDEAASNPVDDGRFGRACPRCADGREGQEKKLQNFFEKSLDKVGRGRRVEAIAGSFGRCAEIAVEPHRRRIRGSHDANRSVERGVRAAL